VRHRAHPCQSSRPATVKHSGGRHGQGKADLAAIHSEVSARVNPRESQSKERRKVAPRVDDLLSIIAVGACLVALRACAVAYYLSASI
jgi:hypothetical protein